VRFAGATVHLPVKQTSHFDIGASKPTWQFVGIKEAPMRDFSFEDVKV